MRRTFEAWLDASDAHADAYARVSGARRKAQTLAGEPTLLALRHETLARTMLVRKPSRVKHKAIAAAVLLLATAPLAAWGIHRWAPQWTDPTSGETFYTDIGQQADVTLPDGSSVTLDTASRLKVSFTGSERRVELEGQGWFDLEPSGRPFVIAAGGRSFTAQQGAFDVRTDPDRVRAFAAKGTMAMAGGDSSIAVQPGRLLDARGNDVTISTPRDPSGVTGWRSGLLLFDNVPLAQAAGELNRYRRQPITVADNRAAGLRVSGAFRTAESPAFVDALTTGFPVRVKQAGATGIVVASR